MSLLDKPNVARRSEVLLQLTFGPLDRMALGIAVGLWAALAILVATLVLVIKGGTIVGPHLQLLGQYFPGYTVTWTGSLLGSGYGFLLGFSIGWTVAFVRNLAVSLHLHLIRLRSSLNTLLDE
jgi:hypothetical protein